MRLLKPRRSLLRMSLMSLWRFPSIDEIGSDQLCAVQRASNAALLCSCVNAVIVAASLWGVVHPGALLAWLVGTGVVYVGLYIRRPDMRPRGSVGLSSDTMRRATWTSALSAAPWAAMVLLWFGNLPHTNELVIAAVCAAMAAGASALLAPVYPAAIAYMSVLLLPFSAKCLVMFGAGYGLLGLLTVSYGAFLLATIATYARYSVDRTETLRALTRSKELLEQRDNLITAQNERFETALNNMTQGLCFFDRDERLIVCNHRYVEMYGLDADRVRPGTLLRDIVDMRYKAGTGSNMSRNGIWNGGGVPPMWP